MDTRTQEARENDLKSRFIGKTIESLNAHQLPDNQLSEVVSDNTCIVDIGASILFTDGTRLGIAWDPDWEMLKVTEQHIPDIDSDFPPAELAIEASTGLGALQGKKVMDIKFFWDWQEDLETGEREYLLLAIFLILDTSEVLTMATVELAVVDGLVDIYNFDVQAQLLVSIDPDMLSKFKDLQ